MMGKTYSPSSTALAGVAIESFVLNIGDSCKRLLVRTHICRIYNFKFYSILLLISSNAL